MNMHTSKLILRTFSLGVEKTKEFHHIAHYYVFQIVYNCIMNDYHIKTINIYCSQYW